jgi:hypothetical protein
LAVYFGRQAGGRCGGFAIATFPENGGRPALLLAFSIE